MTPKYVHPAAWEVDWINQNAEHYDGELHQYCVSRAILVRKSFTSGHLLNDKAVFHKWLMKPDSQSNGVPGYCRPGICATSVLKAMLVTELASRWEVKATAKVSLITHLSIYDFEEIKDYYYPGHDEVYDTPEELLKSGFLNMSSKLEEAVFQMLSKEIGQKTAIFVAGNSTTKVKCLTMVADIHGFVYTYKVVL